MSAIVNKNLLFGRLLLLEKNYRITYSLARRKCSQNVVTNPVRVRFAPSPTGFIHLGGLRTAFFNYLFAKKHGGTFILRVEDTDQERVVPGSFEHIIDTLKWSKLVPDEGPTFGGQFGPYIQSQRTDLYKEMIDKLLETKAVYRCFCSNKRLELLRREAAKNRETIKYDNRCRSLSSEEVKENLKQDKPYTIRLRLKEGPLTVNDLVYGPVTYDLSKIEGDPIIIKSDGLPTYHFANVVDDHFMRISHVLRGFEWLVSTPKHLMMYEAFGWPAPQYAHLPLILNRDGSKLSKRHDHIRIDTYRQDGYYPETINNYLTQMGGGFGSLDTAKSDKVYSLATLCEAFNLAKVNQNNCRIDTDKIKLLNREAIKEQCRSNIEGLVVELRQLLEKCLPEQQTKSMVQLENTEYIRQVIEWSLDRIHSLKELTGEEFLFLWSPPHHTWTPSSIGSPELITSILTEAISLLKHLPAQQFSDKDALLAHLKELHQTHGGDSLKFSAYMKLLRLALTNLKAGSPVAETMQLLGRQRSIQYLEHALAYVHSCTKDQQTSARN